jgi:hypothetical protein
MMRNLKTYEQFINEASEEDIKKVSLIKKLVEKHLRTEVDYSESSGVFTMKGLVLVYPKVLENLLKTIDIKPKNISKPVKGKIAGDTTFEI